LNFTRLSHDQQLGESRGDDAEGEIEGAGSQSATPKQRVVR
jgi:hypothetical protein